MKKSCKYCGIVEVPHICPKSKRKTDRSRIDNKIYEDKEYRAVRVEVLEDFNYVCLWSLYVHGDGKKANTTHHIIEILDDETKAFDYDNLFPCNSDYHKEIHKLYLRNKTYIQSLLRLMINDFKNKDFTICKYRDKVKRFL